MVLERQRSRFVAQASHELRTPLTNMKTRLYLLNRQPERLAEHLPILEKVTKQMGLLVESLLDMSRLERGIVQLRQEEIIAQDVIAFAAEAHRPVIEEKGQTLRVELPDEPIQLTADPHRLTQVLTNLIANASAYTPSGGVITVRANQTPPDATGTAIVRFEVIDTGMGVPADQREDIFQPFYRIATDTNGAGLGLSIARDIVHLHGGAIRVDSTPGAGSCFSFWLPIRNGAREAQAVHS
jgi:two-component system phosphate regulon sensor histidine kinase PhoR